MGTVDGPTPHLGYRRGSDGERQVVDQEHRIWFTQEATRHEHWEVDHPVLGTITVKRLRQEHTLELIHLTIGSNNLDAEGIECDGPPNAVP